MPQVQITLLEQGKGEIKTGNLPDHLRLDRGWLVGNRRRGPSHFMITPQLQDYIDGLLLGDGSILLHGHGARYSQGFALPYYIWVDKIRTGFLAFGILGRIRLRTHNGYAPYNYKYEFDSLSYSEFIPLRGRWYPQGIKVVPKDLSLSPIVVANWYMGDGSLLKPGRKLCSSVNTSVSLATQGFQLTDILFLIDLLTSIGLSRVNKYETSKGYGILIQRQTDVIKFLDYISPYIVSCFKYKMQYQPKLQFARRT